MGEKFKLIILIFCGALLFPELVNAEVTATLGTREKVFYNNDKTGFYFPDGSYFTYNWNGNLYGVFPGGRSYRVNSNPLASTITDYSLMVGLVPSYSWDSVYVGLVAVYVDPNGVLHGFYHGENGQQLPTGKNLAGIGYARSADGGKTWTKYDRIVSGSYMKHAADPDVKIIGNYLYIWYREAVDETQRRQVVARAPLSSGGSPGSWKKYYCTSPGVCDFTEPGLGGDATGINLATDANISYNTYLDRYIAIDGDSWQNTLTVPRTLPLELKSSKTGIAGWSKLLTNPPMLPTVASNERQLYGSIVSLQGESHQSGRNFWLYYMTQQVSGAWDLTLWRQKVTLTSTSPPAVLGDANGDGKVDTADFRIWAGNYGKSVGATSVSKGNFDGDGKANVMDFGVWAGSLN